MRILHIVMNRDEASGVNTFVRRLDAELRKLGIDSGIMAEGDHCSICNCSIDRLGGAGSTNSESNNREIKQSNNPDIVHIHGLWRGFFHRAAVWARTNRIPVVWSTHGMTAPWSMHHKWWKKCLAWGLYQRGDLRGAALVHSTSENEIKWNQALGLKNQVLVPLGTDLPEKNCSICNCSIDRLGGAGSTNSESNNREIKQSNNVRTLLFVGRIYPVKALDRLIAAFCEALESKIHSSTSTSNFDSLPWLLRIVGPEEDAEYAAQLKAQSNNPTIEQSNNPPVVFAGPKHPSELDAEYANCDCAALVSHTENFGATIVDAMAHGKPVIAGTKTPWREVIERKCGWWVDNDVPTLAKAIADLMAMSDSERAEMGKRGRKLVEEKYTWDAVGKAMLNAYRNVAMGSKCELGPCAKCERAYDTCSPVCP